MSIVRGREHVSSPLPLSYAVANSEPVTIRYAMQAIISHPLGENPSYGLDCWNAYLTLSLVRDCHWSALLNGRR